MPRKWKTGMAAFVLAVAVLLVFPLTASAASTSGAAFTRYAMSATQITPGQSISFTVNTTSAANYVYVYSNVDGITTSGLLTNTLDSGEKVWSVTASPKVSQNITVYASATQELTSSTSAATLQIPVTVSGTQGGTGTEGYGVGSAGVAVNGITESRTGSNVTLTVRTDAQANNVWVKFDGDRFVQGRPTASGSENEKVWTIVFRPSQAQTVTVSANTRYQTNGATNVSHNVMSASTAVTRGTAVINSVSVSPSSAQISYNGSATLTIRTNAETDYVWVDYDNAESDARISSETRTSKTWTVRVSPDRTQTINIYANSGDQTTSGAARRTQRITVSDYYYNNDTNVSFRGNVSARWMNDGYYNSYYYDNLEVTANTTSNATSVWFEVNGYRFPLVQSGTESNGDKRWRYNGNVNNWSYNNNWNYSTITLYASASGSSYSASTQVNVSNSGNYGGSYGGSGQIEWFSQASGSDTRPRGEVRFYATTSTNVTRVRIWLEGTTRAERWYEASDFPYYTGNGIRDWSDLRFTLPSDIPTGSRTVVIEAFVNNQPVGTRTTTINVTN